MTESELARWLAENKYNSMVTAYDQYSPYDYYDILTGHIIELKCREAHYQELLIEKAKYDSLLQVAEINETPMYICSTPKGIWQFNLFLIVPSWVIHQQPRNTFFGNDNKIKKIVHYENVNNGIKLK